MTLGMGNYRSINNMARDDDAAGADADPLIILSSKNKPTTTTTTSDDDAKNRPAAGPPFEAHDDDRFCRICLEGDDDDRDNFNTPINNQTNSSSSNDLIAPCRCKGSSRWVHRSCLDQWRAVNAQELAFSRCSECHAEYHLEHNTGHNTGHKRARYCLLVARDVSGCLGALQLLIAAAGVLVWWVVFVSGWYEQVVTDWDAAPANGFNDTNGTNTTSSTTGNSTTFHHCHESAGCQVLWSYLGGLALWLLGLGIYGMVVLCAHQCHVSESVNAIVDHHHLGSTTTSSNPSTTHAQSLPVTSQGVTDRGGGSDWNQTTSGPPFQTTTTTPQTIPPPPQNEEYRAFNQRYHPRRRRRRYRGNDCCCCWCGPSYYEPYPYYYYYYPTYYGNGDGCCCYCPGSSGGDGCCCNGNHCHHLHHHIGSSSSSSSGNSHSDGLHILLIILAIVGIILCTIGLILGAILVGMAIQRILLRHVWILHKQRLVEEFRVKDLSGVDEEEPSRMEVGGAANSNNSSSFPQPIPAPVVELPPPVPLPKPDHDRLKKLGLVE